MIKVLKRSGIQGTYLSIIKITYRKPIIIHRKPITNIKLNQEKLEAILLKSRTRKGCLLLPYLLNVTLDLLVSKITKGD